MSDKMLIRLNPIISNFPFHNINQFFTIDDKYNAFAQNIHNIFSETLPEIEIQTNLYKNKYPRHIAKALCSQRKLFHRSKHNPNCKNKYKEISKTVKHLIKQHHNQTITKLISSPQNLFSYMRKITKPQPPIPTLIVNDALLMDNTEKCNHFAVVFSRAFNNVPVHTIPQFPINNTNTITDIDFDIISVSNLLKTSPNKNSTSPDGIPFKFLRHCYLPLSPIITEIFRVSLDSGTPPSQWKHSIVTPIYKKGNKHDLNNYRPISLTSTLSRTFERILVSGILQFLFTNNLISEHQFGFLPRRSTTLQLLSTLQEWYNGLLERNPTDCIYIDFRKAFDSVPHRFLLHKLYLYGIRGKIFKWITNFLTDRTFAVKIENSLSEPQPIGSGVPQGSVIGPLLFILYINDLPQVIKLPVQIRLYADDVKIFLTHQSTLSYLMLQEALNNVHKWSTDWSLHIAPDKSTFIRIGTQKNTYSYHIGETELTQSFSIQDLGIIIDQNLTFQDHISKIVKSSYFRSYQLLRNIKSTNPKIWAQLFKIYVLPILEYASEIWNPHLKESINKIEKVQKFYTRIAFTKYVFPTGTTFRKRLSLTKTLTPSKTGLLTS
uniref:Reverse transcriptase domain-containing protein n=1 Tax=Meloidogyne hapla TaxID=6305 RepID=A0A1I8BSL6_MELHA